MLSIHFSKVLWDGPSTQPRSTRKNGRRGPLNWLSGCHTSWWPQELSETLIRGSETISRLISQRLSTSKCQSSMGWSAYTTTSASARLLCTCTVQRSASHESASSRLLPHDWRPEKESSAWSIMSAVAGWCLGPSGIFRPVACGVASSPGPNPGS